MDLLLDSSSPTINLLSFHRELKTRCRLWNCSHFPENANCRLKVASHFRVTVSLTTDRTHTLRWWYRVLFSARWNFITFPNSNFIERNEEKMALRCWSCTHSPSASIADHHIILLQAPKLKDFTANDKLTPWLWNIRLHCLNFPLGKQSKEHNYNAHWRLLCWGFPVVMNLVWWFPLSCESFTKQRLTTE